MKHSLLWGSDATGTVILKGCRAATSGQGIRPLSNFPTRGTEATPTATGQQVLQKHQVHWARAARCPVALGDADVGAAPVVPGAWVGRCGDTKRRGSGCASDTSGLYPGGWRG